MTENQMHFQTEYNTKQLTLEEKILNFSNKIFFNKIYGFCFVTVFNSIYLYFCYYKISIISIFIFFYLLFLIFHIILYQFKGNK